MDDLTIKEAAEVAGVTWLSVNSWILKGRLKAIKYGGHWIIRREDLDTWLRVWQRKPGRKKSEATIP